MTFEPVRYSVLDLVHSQTIASILLVLRFPHSNCWLDSIPTSVIPSEQVDNKTPPFALFQFTLPLDPFEFVAFSPSQTATRSSSAFLTSKQNLPLLSSSLSPSATISNQNHRTFTKCRPPMIPTGRRSSKPAPPVTCPNSNRISLSSKLHKATP